MEASQHPQLRLDCRDPHCGLGYRRVDAVVLADGRVECDLLFRYGVGDHGWVSSIMGT